MASAQQEITTGDKQQVEAPQAFEAERQGSQGQPEQEGQTQVNQAVENHGPTKLQQEMVISMLQYTIIAYRLYNLKEKRTSPLLHTLSEDKFWEDFLNKEPAHIKTHYISLVLVIGGRPFDPRLSASQRESFISELVSSAISLDLKCEDVEPDLSFSDDKQREIFKKKWNDVEELCRVKQ